MASCPFCKATISEDLVRFGGRCPKCFNHIPGEEEATHPGVVVPPVEEKKPNYLIPAISVVTLLVGMGVVGWTLLRPEDVARAPINAEFYILPLEDLQEAAMIPANEPAPVHKNTQKVEKSATPSEASQGSITPKGEAEGVPDRLKPDESTGATGGVAQSSTNSTTTGVGVVGVSGGTSVNRKGMAPMTDPNEIKQMVVQTLGRYGTQLKQCYEQQLKITPDLAGVWTLSFTLQPDGKAADIQLKADKKGDIDFESCMKSRVQTWQFSTIAQPMPFAKPYRFGS